MTKIFKKIAAIAMATAMTATMAVSVSAAEPVNSDTWSVAGVAVSGAPSGTGRTDSCYMVYSTDGIDVYCNEVTNSVDGGTGVVKITCGNSNVTMSTKTLRNTGEHVTCTFVVSGAIRGITLKFSATASAGNIYNAYGNAYTN